MSNDIIRRFIELLAQAQPSFSEEIALNIEQQLRHEYGGARITIYKRARVRELIAERFTGNNTAKLAREMSVSRRTVYRAVKGQK